jgi:multiple sugar transport system permease protein
MGIISQVGRKDPRVRLVIGAIYLSLIVGALSILLPFFIMLTLSVSSVTDVKHITLFPPYLLNDQALFTKYLAEKNSEDINKTKESYPVEGQAWVNWDQVTPTLRPWSREEAGRMRLLKGDWDSFRMALPGKFYVPAYTTLFANGRSQYDFQRFLAKRYPSVEAFNKANGMNLAYLSTVNFPDDNYAARDWYFDETPFLKDYFDFKALMSAEYRRVSALNPAWGLYLRYLYKDDLRSLNRAWGSKYQDSFFNDIPFPLEPPQEPARRKDWAAFLHEKFSLNWLKVTGGSAARYQAFLKARYGRVEEFNTIDGTHDASWSQVAFPAEAPNRAEIKDWGLYVNTLPLTSLSLDFPELRWRDFLVKKYGSLDKAGQAYGLDLRSPDGRGIFLPQRQDDEVSFKQGRTRLRLHFLTYNYRMICRFLLLQDRAYFNTLILVLFSIFTALTVNPIAAYALSRFRYRYTHKILLVLLATAAFPAEVSAIPQFLLIKKFGMLNTFWALVLPGIANGFWIFMLKGFFDSLPKELYEAAILDGAGEATMFLRVTAPLAAPILALTAFGAFNEAYGSYLWNIIVANNSKMWTVMVALQQYMGANPTNMVMAAIVVSSIPTLLAFLLVQRVILRGIVIPTLH